MVGETAPKGTRGGQDDGVLRAKYLDHCSARVAEALIRLTADEMYLLAQASVGEGGRAAKETMSFRTIVRLVTERLMRDLALPSFSDWVIEYNKDPEVFERESIGLWEADLRTWDPGSP